MERLIEILEEIQPEVDYTTCTNLIDDTIWTPSPLFPWWQSWKRNTTLPFPRWKSSQTTSILQKAFGP